MRSPPATTHRTASPLHSPPAALLRSSLILLAALTTPQLRAQTAPQPTPPEASPYTLHVYTNLLQIPTLVLNPTLHPLPPISPDKFNISLDSGPTFHPTHMRLEGDDPIDLAILLDLSGDTYNLQSALSHSIQVFTKQSLQPHDHVSIYAIDCIFVRAANDVPANESDRIAHALDEATTYPDLHGEGERSPRCAKSLHLWNALTKVAESIGTMPGRRVILVISNGRDTRSVVTWSELARYASARSIAIFGLYPAFDMNLSSFSFRLDEQDQFDQLCQLTGGLVLSTSYPSVPTNLKRVVDLLRGRYILEFPRPDAGGVGDHHIDVTITKTDAFIRPAGISYPAPDPALLKDPTTIPSTPSPATFGTRHPLDQKN
jgi:hypothetical protein